MKITFLLIITMMSCTSRSPYRTRLPKLPALPPAPPKKMSVTRQPTTARKFFHKNNTVQRGVWFVRSNQANIYVHPKKGTRIKYKLEKGSPVIGYQRKGWLKIAKDQWVKTKDLSRRPIGRSKPMKLKPVKMTKLTPVLKNKEEEVENSPVRSKRWRENQDMEF